ncbi:4-hydroxy-tetrahydrodipicolinate reductase [Virgibacillus sp. YIM 98842]|uniref:4-hydroxy-tetrahydrodipicolinate reductase n=1 Tax=Virgibacillus sp. YIM 98842 TaxID=2663533 RepID=UPI0013DCBDD3|nr:4-hydroxy-tetrahydrodipicolinate reductase [Virgibacillus sp. YIM 98842]
MSINVILAGPRGRMGSQAINMLLENKDAFTLTVCIDRKHDGVELKDIDGMPDLAVPVYEDPEACFRENEADVFIDLTVPDSGYRNTKAAILHNIRPVVGTTGFTDDQIKDLTFLCEEKKLGAIIAPNFAIGAVLMMKFSKMAAAYFPDVDIIEKHHDQKLDAPSGTAVKTAELMKETRTSKKQGHVNEQEVLEGARGADVDGMKIHSVRMPGLVAHQEVIFGGKGQTLTIKHDSINRDSFMEGIKVSVKQVMELEKLVYGLENIL